MKKQILIIDDSEIFRLTLEKTLELKNYEVVARGDGVTALEWLNENLPDLVICDIQMEPMDGYVFLDKFRKGKYTERTPVIMLSGVENSKDRVKCYNSGAQDFLKKPFNADELDELIKKNLDPIHYEIKG